MYVVSVNPATGMETSDDPLVWVRANQSEVVQIVCEQLGYDQQDIEDNPNIVEVEVDVKRLGYYKNLQYFSGDLCVVVSRISIPVYVVQWTSNSGDAHDNGCDVFATQTDAVEAFGELCTLPYANPHLNHLYYDGDNEGTTTTDGVFAVQISTHDI